MRASTWFLVVLIALVGIMIGYSSLQGHKVGVMVFPWAIGSVLLVLFIAQGVTEVRETSVTNSELGQVQGTEEGIKNNSKLSGFAWLLSILPVLYLVGYTIGIPIYVLVSMKWRGEGWILSMFCSAFLAAMLYFGFSKYLHIPFYSGILF